MHSEIEMSAQAIADALAPTQTTPSARWRWGTVKSVSEYGTMNVEVGGSELVGIRCAQHVMGAQVGDRVRVLYCGTEAMVDAVRASSALMSVPSPSMDADTQAAWLDALGLGAPYHQYFGDWVNLHCWGHIAILTVTKSVVLNGSWASADICTVPEQYRPSHDSYVSANLQDSVNNNVTLYIGTNGVVQAKVRGGTSPGSTAHFVSGTLVWSY